MEANPITLPPVRYWIGALLVFLAAFCFALKGIKLAYQHQIDAISLLTLRMVFALPFYVGISIYLAQQLSTASLSIQNWLKMGLLGIIGYWSAF